VDGASEFNQPEFNDQAGHTAIRNHDSFNTNPNRSQISFGLMAAGSLRILAKID
jgi:hypothetical protein